MGVFISLNPSGNYSYSLEGQEGKNAYIEKRKPNFRKYPWLP